MRTMSAMDLLIGFPAAFILQGRLQPLDYRLAIFAKMELQCSPFLVCNFRYSYSATYIAEIWVYDMDQKRPAPVKIALEDLQNKYHMLSFLVSKETERVTEEVELSKAAGELVGKIRDRFLTQYNDPLAKRTQKSLNILCVRLVFCFYAEDAGLFGAKDAFCNYLMQYHPKDMRGALIELFKTLDTPLDERADLYLSDELAAFPYVNGGLFSDENIVIPKITQEIKDTLIESSKFDWSRISPTIFGAVFESTLNPETRRSGGMHYTSIENIHKVIDPLFLDELKEELDKIREIAVPGTQKKKLDVFQDKLASLVFLDPACGSGNFLTETFLSLRRLENEVLRLKVAADRKIMTGQISFGFDEASPIRVSIHQFYGIEINDFAVSVAQTALWIAESQMFRETEDIIHSHMEFFPLKEYRGIREGNALRIDWNDVVPKERVSYIMGNPPFVGASNMTSQQKDEAVAIFGKIRLSNSIDYVGAWYHLAAKYIDKTFIQCAFVSTNSITQGEQVYPLWKSILFDKKIRINFAYRTFIWDSEATIKAHVHCVIIGFSQYERKRKVLFDSNSMTVCNHISPYLIDSPDVLILSRAKPIDKVPPMIYGNKPTDDGNYILTREEKDLLISKEPTIGQYIHRFSGAHDYINGGERYCIWLHGVSPSEIRKSKFLQERVNAVYDFRSKSSAEPTRKKAATASEFFFISQPEGTYILVPRHSSQKRRYVPFGFLGPEVIAADSCSIIPNAELYHFGVLISNVHMAWMRTVCGRIKSDYRYSGSLVYNTFPWPNPTDEMKKNIEVTAQEILQVRKLYSSSTLSDLYDPVVMPPELRKAHAANDRAVMQAYGMPIKETDEASCVAWLMRLYQEKVEALGK